MVFKAIVDRENLVLYQQHFVCLVDDAGTEARGLRGDLDCVGSVLIHQAVCLDQRRQVAHGQVRMCRQPILARKVRAVEILGLDCVHIDKDMEPRIAFQDFDGLFGLQDGRVNLASDEALNVARGRDRHIRHVLRR